MHEVGDIIKSIDADEYLLIYEVVGEYDDDLYIYSKNHAYRCMKINPESEALYESGNFVTVRKDEHIVKVYEFDTKEWRDVLLYDALVSLDNSDKAERVTEIEMILGIDGLESIKDFPDYRNIPTIDQCLDAMNDIAFLEEFFEGSDYTKEMNLVIQRLSHLATVKSSVENIKKMISSGE